MKKITAALLTVLLLTVSLFSFSASAWETPKLMLAAHYNEDTQIITVQYRLLDFAGTESADFRMKYNSDIMELIDYTAAEMKNCFIEIGVQTDNKNVIALQFVDLYHVEESDCEEDGSATIGTLVFKLKNDSASEAVFIATADSCAMDPDTTRVTLDRATLKIALSGGTTSSSTVEDYEIPEDMLGKPSAADNIKKIVIAACVAAAVFVIALVIIVVHYRKKGEPEDKNEKDEEP